MAKILFIGNLSREDYLGQFFKLLEKHVVIAINTRIDRKIHPSLLEQGFTIRQWSDFSNVQQIVGKYQPDYIVSLHLENYTEILFKLISYKRNIPYFLIDHGLYFFKSKKIEVQGNRHASFKVEKVIDIESRLRYKLFVELSLLFFHQKLRKAFRAFISLNREVTSLNEKRLILSKLLNSDIKVFKPDLMIHYSEHNMHVVNQNYQLEKHDIQRALIGFPQFDEYIEKTENKAVSTRNCFIIDQPGFGVPNKAYAYREIGRILAELDYTVYIKKHPYTPEKEFSNLPGNFKAIDELKTLKDLYPSIDLCISFFSTLVLPFILKKDCKVFSYIDGNVDPNNPKHFFIAKGLAQRLDLATFSKDITKDFTPDSTILNHVLYKSDGLAGQRLSALFESVAL